MQSIDTGRVIARLVAPLVASLFILLSDDSVAIGRPDEISITVELAGGQKLLGFQGAYSVPENRRKDSGRRLTLRYVRLPATATPAGPPIIYLAGGPGASGIEAIRYRSAAFSAMRKYGDVIALDQRGTGTSSAPPTCVSHEFNRSNASDDEFRNTQRTSLAECLVLWRNSGVDIAAYNTRENALDLEDLRLHLGAEKITLWGTSYGAQLALAAMRERPENIDKVVLSSVRGLDQNWKLPATLEPYLNRLQQAVDAQKGGRDRFGDIRDLIGRVHASLDAARVSVSLKDAKGGSVEYMLNRRDMQLLAVSLFADPSGAARMLEVYRALDRHEDPRIDQIPSRLLPDHLVAVGQPISINCMNVMTNVASGISRSRRTSALRQSPMGLFAAYLDQTNQYDGMAPEVDVGESFRKTPSSTIPSLIFSGSLDGRTVLEEQSAAIIGLHQARQITVKNAGHNLFDSPTADMLLALDQFMTRKPVTATGIIVAAPRFVPEQ